MILITVVKFISCKVRLLLIILIPSLVLTSVIFSFPAPVNAANIPHNITPAIPVTPSSTGATFFTTNLTVNYQSGNIILSSQPNGTGNVQVDDGLDITVTRPDGTTISATKTYHSNCMYLVPSSPQDFTNLFLPGENKISIRLYDICGGDTSSTPLYLVNTNAITKTPVVFIPGIGGSELKSNQTFTSNIKDCNLDPALTYQADEVVWVNIIKAGLSICDDYFDVLKLKADGQTPEYPQIVLNNKIFQGSYGDTIKFFTDNGYELGKTLFLFPYDWRKDISLTTAPLDELIGSIKQQTGSSKVDIVAHSMGGLVARNYINDAGKAQNVRKLVTLGAPYLGATEFIRRLVYGACLTPLPINTGLLCLGLAPSEVKDVVQNMISGFELSPSKKYFEFYNNSDNFHPYPFRDDIDVDNNSVIGPLNYGQIKTLFNNLGHNTALFTPAETFHNLDNSLPETNGVEVSIIAGSGQPTLGQIIEKYAVNFAGIKIPHKDMLKINGDETVPLFSASLNDPTSGLSLTGPAKVYYTKQTHGSLVSNGPAMDLVKNILNNDNSLPNEVSDKPYSFNGDLLSVHSPVNIHVYDENGNHTGLLANGDFEANIPGSYYDSLDDAKFIWLPSSGVYTIKFEATDAGSFDFKIKGFVNDENNQAILYNDIPLTTDTKAETVFDTISPQSPILQVDTDGNGTPDLSKNADVKLIGDAAHDQIPPQTQIALNGTVGTNNWYTSDVTVTLTASDNGNSGLEKIEYSLDNGQTVETYTNPFIISSEGLNKLKVKSTDKAGNEEILQEVEIKIDKTPPEAKVSFNLQTQKLDVTAVDNLTTSKTNHILVNEVIFIDDAGNTTKLYLDPGATVENLDQLAIRNILYNTGLSVILPTNGINTKFTLDKRTNKPKEFIQEVQIENQIAMTATYNAKNNQTEIQIQKAGGEKSKKIENGI
ncbi:alpha/beta hydrolase, partial [Candidatus Daviesbacteria bacterium]|nr:alpha/beta hydrolase [Candidatus Daviesbacteria bacterium]